MFEEAERFGYPVMDLPPSADSTASVVKFLVDELVRFGRLRPDDKDRVVCQILHRESLGSTGVGCGVAVPHSKSDAVKQTQGVVGRAAHPIGWTGALDSAPVHVVCLFVTPASDPEECMRALKSVSEQLRTL